jgi:DHA1 family tetracycline resistance protein-like MFS transporter
MTSDFTPRSTTPGRRLAPLFPAVAASYLGYAMMATLFVPMLMSTSAGYLPVDDSLSRRTTVLGVLLILYPLGQFLGNSILGSLSDQYGRRRVLLLSSVGTILCYVGIGVALEVKHLVLLAPFLVLCGLVEANTALAMSAIADVTTETTRPKYIALVYAVTSVAYAVGPPLGGVLAATYGYALPFWIVLGGLVAVLVWLQFAFVETLPAERRQHAPVLRSLSGLSEVFTDAKLRRLYLANFLAYVSVMGFGRVITIYLVDTWQLSVGKVAACYSALAVGAGIANFLLTPRLSRKMSMRTLAVGCLAIGGVAVAAVVIPGQLGMSGSLAIAVVIIAVAGVVLAISLAAVAAVLSAAAPDARQGKVMGNNAALLVLGEVVGVSGGAFIAGIRTWLPLLVLAVLAVVAGALIGIRRSVAAAEVLVSNPSAPVER